MAFIRTIKKENPFVQIDRYVFEDEHLSWKAKGLMGYLLSRPDNWKIRHTDLTKRAKESKNTVTAILKELQLAGYINYYQERLEGGKFGKWIYDVYERPAFNPHFSPVPKNRDTDNRDTDLRDTDNWDINNKELNNKDLNNNDINNIEEEEGFEINNFAFKTLVKDFNETYPDKYDNDLWKSIYNAMIELKLDLITFKEAETQARAMQKKIDEGIIIADYAKYFVGGIKRKRTSKKSALIQNKMSKAKPQPKKEEHIPTVPFYNWLEK